MLQIHTYKHISRERKRESAKQRHNKQMHTYTQIHQYGHMGGSSNANVSATSTGADVNKAKTKKKQ